MLNNLSKYSPYNLKDFIVNGKSYRANPNNVYHEYYQASVNRWFMFFIVLCILLSVLLFRGPVILFIHLFPMLWIGVFYGSRPLASFVLGMATVYLFTFICWTLKLMVPDIICVFKQFFIEGRCI